MPSPHNGTPALLTAGFYYGSLAAARSYGRAGIPVTLAEPNTFAPTRWSRYVTRALDAPSLYEAEGFVEWLLRFGERNPRHVLCPTTDDSAWLFSLYREELGRYFALFQPPVSAVDGLLHKQLLYQNCLQLGIDTPRTWCPDSDQAVQQIAREARFPLVIKPLTQILSSGRGKGILVERAADLEKRYWRYWHNETPQYASRLLQLHPEVVRPILQEYHPQAAQGIYSISGFVDRAGRYAVRASMKVLQRPRRLGTGLCFEEAPVRQHIVDQLLSLCHKLKFYGVFEVEFIESDDRLLLIDYNPRFYNQMAFDIDRGLPLPLLLYQAALGNDSEVERLIEQADLAASGDSRVYTHRFTLDLVLNAQRLSGVLSSEEEQRWRSWRRAHEGRITDAVFDASDRWPSFVDASRSLCRYARHPRAFVNKVVFDR